MNNTVKVIVASSAGNGSSTVAELVWMQLIEYGFSTQIEDVNYPTDTPLINRTDALRGNISVSIETAQLNQSAMNLDLTCQSAYDVMCNLSRPPFEEQVRDLKMTLTKSEQKYNRLLDIASRLVILKYGSKHYPTDEELTEFKLK